MRMVKRKGDVVNCVYDFSDVISIATTYLDVLEGPVVEQIKTLLRDEKWDEIVSLSLPDWVSADSPLEIWRDSLLAISLLKKVPFRHANLHPTATAHKTYVAAEVSCRNWNRFFRNIPTGSGHNAIIMHAQDVIADVLGEFDYADLLEASGPGRHSASGAGGEKSHLLHHFSELTYVDPTGRLRCSLYDIVAMRGTTLTEVAGSKLDTVPKTGKTDRTITLPPSLELFFQRGLGTLIAEKLEPHGVTLADQRRNQKLALYGSYDHEDAPATIDLSSASDTVASELVWQLLARVPEWRDWIFLTRSENVILPGKRLYKQEKISSMGDGFTFPLESLIFYALVIAMSRVNQNSEKLQRDSFAVYGDDIVVPGSLYEQTILVLELFGFTINKEKSYHVGPYRESCGIHCLSGLKVRPLFLQDTRLDVPGLYRVINTVLAQSIEEGIGVVADSRWRDAYRKLLRMLPKEFRTDTCPPLKEIDSLYAISITDSVLYDLRAPLTRCPDGREGILVVRVVSPARRIFGFSRKSRDEVIARRPEWYRSACRLMLWQVEQKVLEDDALYFGRAFVDENVVSGSVQDFSVRTDRKSVV